MRIFVETDDGYRIEAKEIESIPGAAEALLLIPEMALGKERQEELEKELSEKLNKKCVVLPHWTRTVIGI